MALEDKVADETQTAAWVVGQMIRVIVGGARVGEDAVDQTVPRSAVDYK